MTKRRFFPRACRSTRAVARAGGIICTRTACSAPSSARPTRQYRKEGELPYLAAQLCDASAGKRPRYSHGTEVVGPCGCVDDDDLHACAEQGWPGRGESVGWRVVAFLRHDSSRYSLITAARTTPKPYARSDSGSARPGSASGARHAPGRYAVCRSPPVPSAAGDGARTVLAETRAPR